MLSSAILTFILQPLQGLAIRINHHKYNGLPLVPHTLNLHWKHLFSQKKEEPMSLESLHVRHYHTCCMKHLEICSSKVFEVVLKKTP